MTHIDAPYSTNWNCWTHIPRGQPKQTQIGAKIWMIGPMYLNVWSKSLDGVSNILKYDRNGSSILLESGRPG